MELDHDRRNLWTSAGGQADELALNRIHSERLAGRHESVVGRAAPGARGQWRQGDLPVATDIDPCLRPLLRLCSQMSEPASHIERKGNEQAQIDLCRGDR